MDDIDPDPDGGAAGLDPDFDDAGWLPDWLPQHPRDTSLDDWI
ncbi:MAG: hypothetical protein ACTHJU_04070 [Sphingopyxis sp.]